MITRFEDLDLTKSYTYADYLTWQFKERVELIKGRIFKMSPAPNRNHQEISINLILALGNFLREKECKVYDAPFDVVLTKEDTSTVVQPDICVICDHRKLTDQGCTGAPEIIMEILSPGNSKRELKEKFELYEQNGVQEYWLVIPNEKTVIIYTLDKIGKYRGSKPFVTGEKVRSSVLTEFVVSIDQIFKE